MLFGRLFVSWVILSMVQSVAYGAVIGKIMPKDGSQLYGEILEMSDGILKAKAAFSTGKPIPITWPEVTGRWSVKFDWLVTPSVMIFHQHQAFPSLEDFHDY